MWRLKVADGGNDSFIYSTNNFVGRQIQEFDPPVADAGESIPPFSSTLYNTMRLNFFFFYLLKNMIV